MRAVDDAEYGHSKITHLLERDQEPGDRVVVLGMAKSGTTALTQTLRAAGLTNVFQVHGLNPLALEIGELDYRQASPDARPLQVWDAQFLLLRPPTEARPWQVVTTIREPIGQAVSAFFQTATRHGSLTPDTTVEEVISRIDLPSQRLNLDWFDEHVTEHLGIDVFAHPFDPAVGHTTIEGEHVRWLVLRRESLDRAPDALATFFGRDEPFPFRSANVAADKGYAELYRQTLQSLRAPAELVDRVCTSRLVRHFYADHEIDALRARWSAPR